MFSNHVYKIIILPTLVIRIPNLEIFLFCQHNSTGGGNLELRQTIVATLIPNHFESPNTYSLLNIEIHTFKLTVTLTIVKNNDNCTKY
jgi:hypothetical protein